MMQNYASIDPVILPARDVKRRLIAHDNDSLFLKLFCGFMIAKPLIDLTWNYGINLGGAKLSLLAVSGAMVAVTGARVALSGRVKANSIVILFYLFICCFFVSFLLSDYPISKSMRVVDQLLRLMGNVAMLFFGLVFAARRSLTGFATIIQSVWIGINAAIFVNIVGMTLGWDSYGTSDGMDRINGLYYDAGVLGLIAVQNFAVCLYLPSLQGTARRKIPQWMIYGSLLASVVLMGMTISRIAIVLAGISMAVYVFMFSRTAGFQQAAFIFLLGTGGILYAFSENEFSRRFSAESEMLSQGVKQEVTFNRGSIDLGDFQRFGSNRGKVIEDGLNEYLQGSFTAQLFGDFKFRTTHSDYVDILGRFGFVGLAVYLSLLSNALFALYRRSKIIGKRYEKALVSLAVSFLFMYNCYSIPFRPLWYTTNSWYVWLFVGLVLGQRNGVLRYGGKKRKYTQASARATAQNESLSRW